MPMTARPAPFVLALLLAAASANGVLGQTPQGDGGRQEQAGARQGGGPPGGDRGAFRRGGGMFRGMAGFTDVLQPEFLSRDLELFQDGLDLDDAQSNIVELLLADYEDAFQAGIEPVTTSLQELGPALMRTFMSPEIRDQMRSVMERAREEIRQQFEQRGTEPSPEEIRALMDERIPAAVEEVRLARIESGDDAEGRRIMGQMITALDAWRAERETLRQAFIEALRVQLTDAQMQEWPSFDRQLVRDKTLGRGRLSGESTDVLAILDRIELDDETFAAAEKAIEGFELQLHEALRGRNEYLAQSESRLLRAVQELDVKQGLDIVRRQIQQRVRVRDVNEAGRLAIAAALPEKAAEEFSAAVLADAFERVKRPTQVDSVLEYVRSLELAPELFAQIDALELAYRMELRGSDDRMITLIRKQEPADELRQAERFAGFLTGDFRPNQGEDPIRDAMRERREFVDQHAERILAVLTPEQRDAAPGGGRRADGRGRGDVTAMLDGMPAEVRQRVMERIDTNRNGQIDPDEQEAAERMMRERGRGWGRGEGGGDNRRDREM